MKKIINLTFYSIISIIPMPLLAEEIDTVEQLPNLCLINVPPSANRTLSAKEQADLPVYIEADALNVIYPEQAEYKGNVKIKQGNLSLLSETAKILQQTDKAEQYTRYAVLDNPFNYEDDLIKTNGKKGKFNLTNKEGKAEQLHYQLVGRQGRGYANSGEIKNNVITMQQADYTTCLEGDNSWRISGSSIQHDPDNQVARIKHAVFRIKNIPIFYFPYLEYPLGSQRRSGVLYPNYAYSSRDGFGYQQSLYWNIRPEMDFTFTPKYMSRRGLMLTNEFRYLTKIGQGRLAYELLNKDRLLDNSKYSVYKPSSKKRTLWNWQHNFNYGNWRGGIDYTKVSDPYYLNHIDSAYGSSTDGYVNQTAYLGYYQKDYNLSISANKYQIFDQDADAPYKTLPKIQFNYYNNKTKNGFANFKLYSEITNFKHDNKDFIEAIRTHLEPSLSLPLSNNYGKLTVGTKLYLTNYHQKINQGIVSNSFRKNINRVIPELKLDLSTKVKFKFNNEYYQTIEPRLVYLYRGYKNQTGIGPDQYKGATVGYDSSLLTEDYYSLFNGRMYSGIDRIESANLYTLGFTSRIFNPMHQEKFNFSIAQTFYINPPKLDDNFNKKEQARKSSIGINSNLHLNDNYHVNVGYVYNQAFKKTSFANASFEYRKNDNDLIQLNYRYIGKDFIQNNLYNRNNYDKDLAQVGIVFSKKINQNYSVVGKYYHDLKGKSSMHRFLGLQYENCCWVARVGYSENLFRKYGSSSRDKAIKDRGVSFNIELIGFNENRKNGIVIMRNKDPLPFTSKFK